MITIIRAMGRIRYLAMHMGVVQNYGTRKLPLRRAFANLSRPSWIGTWDYDQVFVCKFETKIYRRIAFKNIISWRSVFKAALVSYILAVRDESVPVHRVDGIGQVSVTCTHSLKSFWSCDIAERTSPFWVRVGSGRIHLSRAFRGPFANLSRISRLKNEFPETNVYARVSLIIYANQGATANLRTWDNTKHESCGNSARKTAKHEYCYYNLFMYIYIYVFINSGIQTFRKPYAALSRPFATATKHIHPYLQMSLGY